MDDVVAHQLRQVELAGEVSEGEVDDALEDALETLRHLPETPETQEQEIDVRIDLRGSLYPLGEFEKNEQEKSNL